MANATLARGIITASETCSTVPGRPVRKRKTLKTLEEMNFGPLDAYLASIEPDADREIHTPVSKKRKTEVDEDDFVSDYLTPPFEQPDTALPTQVEDSEPVIVGQEQDATVAVPSKKVANTKIAKKEAAIFYLDETAEKPDSIGQPAVWADKRQQLTETLPWYKTNQASAYTNNGMVYGFLIDKAVSPRDVFNDDIIICTVGGGKEKDVDGKMVLADDQKPDHSRAKPFKAAMKQHQVVGAIVGQGNKNCPVKLSHYYSVLGFYHITDVWYDKYEKKCWMIRAERVSPLWCSPKSDLIPLPSPTSTQALVQTCVHCNEFSKQLYTEGWVCMNAHCKYNWNFGREVDTTSLVYHPEFLGERTQFDGEVPTLFAPLPIIEQSSNDLTPLSKQGIVCPKCNCCTRRIHWTYWACENDSCDFELHPSANIMTVAEAKIVNGAKWKAKKDLVTGGIETIPMNLGAYSVTKYLIPDEQGEFIGFVSVFKSNQLINRQPNGPDDLFRQMQEPEFDLKRNSARGGDSTGQMLTNHYGRNFGATYKFGVQQESQGFDVSPDVILKILMRTGWAANQAVIHHTPDGSAYEPPNELLCLGYYADNKIDYHDDGEKTLGHTVISLSLGCSATMCFRPKAKSTMGTSGNAKGSKPDVLRFQLDHGDMMVMHGPVIQKLYEHCVIPYGHLRFALTARKILYDKMTDPRDRAQAITAGTIPQRAAAFIYDGDVETLSMEPLADQQALEEAGVADGAAEVSGEI